MFCLLGKTLIKIKSYKVNIMKTYIATFEYRKGGGATLGPFTTLELARAAVLEEMGWTEEEWKNYIKYGSSFEEGTIYTEENTVIIEERELNVPRQKSRENNQ